MIIIPNGNLFKTENVVTELFHEFYNLVVESDSLSQLSKTLTQYHQKNPALWSHFLWKFTDGSMQLKQRIMRDSIQTFDDPVLFVLAERESCINQCQKKLFN